MCLGPGPLELQGRSVNVTILEIRSRLRPQEGCKAQQARFSTKHASCPDADVSRILDFAQA